MFTQEDAGEIDTDEEELGYALFASTVRFGRPLFSAATRLTLRSEQATNEGKVKGKSGAASAPPPAGSGTSVMTFLAAPAAPFQSALEQHSKSAQFQSALRGIKAGSAMSDEDAKAFVKEMKEKETELLEVMSVDDQSFLPSESTLLCVFSPCCLTTRTLD